MDEEDRLFVKVVGERSARLLKTKNVRMWTVFKQACDENGEKPEKVLGNILLKFAKSVVDKDGSFAEDIMGRSIKISAITRRDELFKRIDDIIGVRRKIFESDTSSNIDKIIEQMIIREISSASSNPLSLIQNQQQQVSQQIVIDSNLLASLGDNELDELEKMIKHVKESKKSIKEVVSNEVVNSEEEEVESIGDDKVSEGDEGISSSK